MLPLVNEGTDDMLSQDDENYFRGRAIEERIAAEDASRADVAQIHLELARLYQALADQPELRQLRKSRLTTDGDGTLPARHSF